MNSERGSATRLRAGREEGMGGLAKGLAIIESFNAKNPRLTISEAAAASGITPAAARRCLRTLEELGFVMYDGKFYRPTPRMMRLSSAYSEADSLSILAGPRLVAAREAFDESASLAVLDGEEIIFVARSESSHTASTGMRVGSRMPALLAAAGRVLIAAQSEEQIAAHLESFRPVRLSDGSAFTVAAARGKIEETAQLGYSYTDEELEAGVRAIAVPVVNARGATLAAMSISALSARFTMGQMRERFLPVLLEEARRLGSML